LRVAELEAEHQRLLLENDKLRRPQPAKPPPPVEVKPPSTSPIHNSAKPARIVHDPTTTDGREALLKEGHGHRKARRFEAAAQAYERARSALGPGDEAWVEATFQLAWNASFEGDRDAAVRLFQDAAGAPGATEKFKAMSAYNIAAIRESKEDIALALVEYEAVVRDFGESTNGMVRHYVKLARDAVERLK